MPTLTSLETALGKKTTLTPGSTELLAILPSGPIQKLSCLILEAIKKHRGKSVVKILVVAPSK